MSALAGLSNDGLVQSFAVDPRRSVSKFETSLTEPVRRLRVDLMFDGLYAGAEFVGGFVRIDGELPLQDTWSAVEFFGDKMHSAAMPFIARIENSLMSVEPRVGWQQRRMAKR